MNVSDWIPSQTYPDLSADRLATIAALVRQVRNEAAASHEPDKGDTQWGLGCRAFERTCYALTRASQQYTWLSRVHGDDGGPTHFIFTIGIIPIRFYRGSPEDAPPRYQSASDPERDARQLALDLDCSLPHGRVLRLAVETAPSGIAMAVRLVEFDEQTHEVLNSYTIEPAVPSTVTPLISQPPAIELAPPAVEVITPPAAKQGDAQ